MVQLGSGITTIQLSVANNSNSFIPTILWDDQDVILFDTGIPGQLELIRAAFQELSIPFEKLTKIIITHQDMDHIGSLPALVEALGDQVQVLAHERAVPYLAGEIPLVKSKKLAPPVKVDVALKDGDILPFVGGIRVVYTPGHTPDHTSYYHIPSKTLIAGDALTAKDGVLQSYNPTYTPDQETALASIAKLQELELDAIIAFHGGICTDNLQARLQEIVTAGPVVNN
ncbi:MBL fold metallo-hydrolase [Paenibacillus chondroitinus]|uniref:MBL fold metallo-hydrolase n=1 Tax=Paenibacillus chondroitinus TaxID=59842 RepID=A0ABU6D7V7_9BACL|nr:MULTISPECIES: MBL fold metallo-hydrolase [Paenibacillus]MCY9661741.1 MBL fold metallo-hydrolase [Paenibacillus anseongense]MEB4793826.1 MBL fold metallo-hydrolase [Paenibacillus chondroitinus]